MKTRKLILPSLVALSLILSTATIWLNSSRSGNTAGDTQSVNVTEYPVSEDSGFTEMQALYTSQPDGVDEGLKTLQNLQSAFRSIASNVIPSVVEIDVVSVVQQPAGTGGSPFEFFFGPRNGDSSPREFRQQGLGSGVIVRRTGDTVYVLTNNHVAGEADEISVSLSDGRSFPAELVGTDPNKDLALVSFTTDEYIPVAQIGNSEELQAGDWVVAVGSPLGFESTITAGIVSAIGRETLPASSIAGFTDYIQTDAAINQGNSGGALVNIYGQVVGINTWIASNSGGSVGLGFAIPINNAKNTIDDLIADGKIEYGWLGITMGTMEDRNGAFVYGVFEKSPADKAGILPGDYITRVNGTSIKDSGRLMRIIGNIEPGRSADFDIIRNGKSLSLKVKIAVRGDESTIAQRGSNLWPGFTVLNITEEIRSQLDLSQRDGNVIVSGVSKGSPAESAGLKAGDLIRRINSRKVDSLDEFYQRLNSSTKKDVTLSVQRQGADLTIELER